MTGYDSRWLTNIFAGELDSVRFTHVSLANNLGERLETEHHKAIAQFITIALPSIHCQLERGNTILLISSARQTSTRRPSHLAASVIDTTFTFTTTMSSLAESGLRTSTIVTIAASTVFTGLVAYAVYFDHRRRTDPDFRRQLKRDSKKSQRAAKLEAEASTRARRDEIRALVEQVNSEQSTGSVEGNEQIFMEEVSKGENLLTDESQAMEAALCFFRALKVYPTPEELINIYDKTVPKASSIPRLVKMHSTNSSVARPRYPSGNDCA